MAERRLGNYLMLETLGQGGFSKSDTTHDTTRDQPAPPANPSPATITAIWLPSLSW